MSKVKKPVLGIRIQILPFSEIMLAKYDFNTKF
jgi:hypothetical protein